MNAIDAATEKLSALGIHSVLAQFCDIHGVARGKLVPVALLKECVEVGAGFSGPSIWGTGLPRHGPRSEYYGRVQLASLRPLPFMPGVAHAVCDGFAGGEPLDTCPRQLLQRQLQGLERRGWKLHVGIEPEFFLLAKDADGQWSAHDREDRLSKPSYDLKSIQRNQGWLEDMRRTLVALGFDLQQIDHEDANGQYEINYRFDEALQAADRFMLFKLAAQALSQQHGMVFSCMPKPFADTPGSGLHFHLSLTDAQGRPIFAQAGDALGLGSQGYAFAAGLLHHADALSALCAPTVNSYKRLAASHSVSGTTWSPVWKAMGDNNRTCLVRAVAGRLEWRLPDPACNVYAAIAATLAAGLHGIDTGMAAPEAATSTCIYSTSPVARCRRNCRATCGRRCRRCSRTTGCARALAAPSARSFSTSRCRNGRPTCSMSAHGNSTGTPTLAEQVAGWRSLPFRELSFSLCGSAQCCSAEKYLNMRFLFPHRETDS